MIVSRISASPPICMYVEEIIFDLLAEVMCSLHNYSKHDVIVNVIELFTTSTYKPSLSFPKYVALSSDPCRQALSFKTNGANHEHPLS
jgi:hypothetical protein